MCKPSRQVLTALADALGLRVSVLALSGVVSSTYLAYRAACL